MGLDTEVREEAIPLTSEGLIELGFVNTKKFIRPLGLMDGVKRTFQSEIKQVGDKFKVDVPHVNKPNMPAHHYTLQKGDIITESADGPNYRYEGDSI